MKKILSLIMAVMILFSLTACSLIPGMGNDSDNNTTQGDNTDTSAPPVEVVEDPYEPNVLTGEKEEGEYPQTTRFAAYMVNNISNDSYQNARPQWGIGEADVLVEILVEGGITRFMALFSDYTETPQIGPIRSARDQFFQLLIPFQALYVHEGESGVQEQFRILYEYSDLDINLGSYYLMRDSQRQATNVALEHTAYTNYEQIQEIIDLDDRDMERLYKSTIFNFVPYDEPERQLTGDANGANGLAAKVDIHHSDNYRTYFEYDESTGKYLMSQYSGALGAIHATVDANTNVQLSFENVLVLYTDIYTAPGHEAAGLQYVEYGFGGVGYYFSNGQAEEVRWGKGAPTDVLRIYDKYGNGTDIQINPGKTYLTVVDLDFAEKFTYYPTLETQATDTTANSTADTSAVS